MAKKQSRSKSARSSTSKSKSSAKRSAPTKSPRKDKAASAKAKPASGGSKKKPAKPVAATKPPKTVGKKAAPGKAAPPAPTKERSKSTPQASAKAPAKEMAAGKPSKIRMTKAEKAKAAAAVAEAVASGVAPSLAAAGAPDKDGYVMLNGRRVRVIVPKPGEKKKPSKEEAAAAAQAAAEKEIEDAKPIRTHLNKQELEHYRQMLLTLRAQKMGDLSAKEDQALRSEGGNLSHMPIHMADVGSDAYDQDFMLSLAESDRKLIREIDEALQRIENKTYGVCLLTRKPIPKARLNAKPWAKYTIEAVRLIESGQAV